MRDRETPTVEDVALVGGRLCLDFANTANWLDAAPVDERLKTFADLTAWGRRKGLIDQGTEGKLNRRGARHRAAAHDALQRALVLRDALWRLFSCGAADRAADLAIVNAARAAPAPELAQAERGGAPVFVPAAKDLDTWLLHPVAASAAELLTAPVRGRVKRCPGDRCGWVFLDDSPSGRRRWCSMKTCGNREKARAHYDRRRGVAGSA